ncbi:uncharacterized protein LOC117106515, partial [Anneissia japonica]|uniref:uncharacterized protein LOC117106515 n=1 Tax=Anneissia japonica TaxID=1529436 RepID=UPI0014259D22
GTKLNKKVYHVVLEQDGTVVDEDEVLMAVKSETLMLLTNEEKWEPVSACKQNIGRRMEPCSSSSSGSETLDTEEDISPTIEDSSRAFCSYSNEIELPQFSSFVKEKLASGQAKSVWSKLIDESAHFFMTKYPNL